MAAQARSRLDVLLVTRGLFPSRERAQAAVMAGRVLVNGKRVDKPGVRVPAEVDVSVIGEDIPYVSRGGLKLEAAVREFGLDFRDLVVLDIGASTGGFTDCALQFGARRVFAVDVGYGQLDWRLRQDRRVVVLEKTNARYLLSRNLGPGDTTIDCAVVDVSFISLSKVLPAVLALVRPDGWAVVLVKPQFEAGRAEVGRKGVVRDPAVHVRVLERVYAAVTALGWLVTAFAPSPIKGPEGNIEYLLYLQSTSRMDEGTSSERGSGPVAYGAGGLGEVIAATVERAWNKAGESS